jgi:hypothetical protein
MPFLLGASQSIDGAMDTTGFSLATVGPSNVGSMEMVGRPVTMVGVSVGPKVDTNMLGALEAGRAS